MPLYQVTCRELVYVDRIYEVEAEDGSAAFRHINESHGGSNCIDEQVQDTFGFCRALHVHDENGNEVDHKTER